jgi:hypothetical protein
MNISHPLWEESTFGDSYRNVPSFDKASVKSENKFESNLSMCTSIYILLTSTLRNVILVVYVRT